MVYLVLFWLHRFFSSLAYGKSGFLGIFILFFFYKYFTDKLQEMTYLNFDLERLLDSFDLDDPFLLFVQVLNGVLQFSLKT